MEEEARSIASGWGGKLALRLSSAIVYGGFPERISAFKRVEPDLEVKLVVHSGDILQELLDAYALDAAVTTLPFSGEMYCCTAFQGEVGAGYVEVEPLSDIVRTLQWPTVPRKASSRLRNFEREAGRFHRSPQRKKAYNRAPQAAFSMQTIEESCPSLAHASAVALPVRFGTLAWR